MTMTTLALLLCLQDAKIEQQVLARLNEIRRIAGLAPVAIDPALSKGCRLHAEYLVRNATATSAQGLGAHDEDPKLPGYTPEGEKAGKASDISYKEPPAAVESWMSGLFHRVPIIMPGLKKIGLGWAKSADGGTISVMDVVSGRGGGPATIVAYPADKQKDVPLALGREIPRPAPTDSGGYPVTLTFHEDQKVTGVTATLRVDKEDVECHLSTPEKPADARYQRNTVCLIAREPLKPATTYTVTVTAKIGTKPFTRTWSFTTVKE